MTAFPICSKPCLFIYMRILTIADQSGFTKAGGIIILTSAKNRINLEINNNAAVQAHVRISSQRLKLSKLGTD